MRVTSRRQKRWLALQDRGFEMRRAGEAFDGPHFTRPDVRRDYGEVRFITVGRLDSRLVVMAWTHAGRLDASSA